MGLPTYDLKLSLEITTSDGQPFFKSIPLVYQGMPLDGSVTVQCVMWDHIQQMGLELLGLGVQMAEAMGGTIPPEIKAKLGQATGNFQPAQPAPSGGGGGGTWANILKG